tara:strand:+ start:581 stop:811 length:231 start_codon:yes stop_codon:yes gene_type:complete
MKIKNMAYWKAKNKISPFKLDLKNVVVVDSEYAKKQKKEKEKKQKEAYNKRIKKESERKQPDFNKALNSLRNKKKK